MQFTYLLNGETPSKKNNRFTLKSGKTIVSERYRVWHEVALLELAKQGRPKEPIYIPCKVSFCFVHNDKVRRDSDNAISSILDTLQDARILKDDNWQIVREIEVRNVFKADAKSGVLVCISDFTEEKAKWRTS